jgi:hypothetical protein
MSNRYRTELPPIAVRVSEHRVHLLRRPARAARTRAELPADVTRGAFGPRVQAAVASFQSAPCAPEASKTSRILT